MVIGGDSITLGKFREKVLQETNLEATADGFDFSFANLESGETYLNDTRLITANSRVLVKRIPHRSEVLIAPKEKTTETNNRRASAQTLASFATSQKVGKVPLGDYVCYRCNQKGHFIQDCPKRFDKSFVPLGLPKEKGVCGEEFNLLAEERRKEERIRQQKLNEGKKTEKQSDNNNSLERLLKCGLCNNSYSAASFLSCCLFTFCYSCVEPFLQKEGHCPVCKAPKRTVVLKSNQALRAFLEKAEGRRIKIDKEEFYKPSEKVLQDEEFMAAFEEAPSEMKPFVNPNVFKDLQDKWQEKKRAKRF